MREFWVASGHHLTRRADHAGWSRHPTHHGLSGAAGIGCPPADACEGRTISLHASCWPIRFARCEGRNWPALADADARENWTFMMNFAIGWSRGLRWRPFMSTLRAMAADGLPPIFQSVQLCHLILRNALEGCDDSYTLRAAELFYRSQQAAAHEGTLLARRCRGRRGVATWRKH